MAETNQNFFSNPRIVEHYTLLEKIGVFKYLDELNKEIKEYQGLLFGASEIFNKTSIDDIINATVWQISDQYQPSFIAFVWKPLQDRAEVTVKGYQNYKLVDIALKIDNIIPFEPFFQENREPVPYSILRKKLAKNTAAAEVLKSLDTLKSELVIPILGPSGLYGLILVGNKIITETPYTPPELLFLRQLMSFVSQAIQNHIHYESSVRDVKTGLFNHGFLTTRLNEEISRTKRTGYTSALVVIDVDKFKNFNDTYGHLAGDKVLECLAHTIRESVRSEDIPSRFGGEEFTILLPNTDIDAALLVAERLRISVSSMTVPWDPPLPQVTISLGIATFNRNSDLTTNELISRADAALYASKNSGRNKTTLWQEGLPATQDN
jgi:diguanylate cyclase (GGDEF)-like protein